MSSNAVKKGKIKPSENSVHVINKGPDAYKDIQWNCLNNDEAKALEKDTSLAWKVLTNLQMQALMPLSVEDMQQQLAGIMDLTNHATIQQDATILDFYVSGFWWGKEQSWNEQQISGLFTVLHRLIGNVREKKLKLEENLTELRKMLVGIGTMGDHNGGLDFLDVTMATSMVGFLSSSFFQHYRLYECLFHSERTEEVVSTNLEVEMVPPADLPHPPPLDEGLPEDLYKRHVAPPPPVDSIASVTIDGPTEGTDAEPVVGEVKDEDADEVVDILAGVTAEDIQTVFDRVSAELFSTLQNHVALKLKERESEIIARINKVHRVLDT